MLTRIIRSVIVGALFAAVFASYQQPPLETGIDSEAKASLSRIASAFKALIAQESGVIPEGAYPSQPGEAIDWEALELVADDFETTNFQPGDYRVVQLQRQAPCDFVIAVGPLERPGNTDADWSVTLNRAGEWGGNNRIARNESAESTDSSRLAMAGVGIGLVVLAFVLPVRKRKKQAS